MLKHTSCTYHLAKTPANTISPNAVTNSIAQKNPKRLYHIIQSPPFSYFVNWQTIAVQDLQVSLKISGVLKNVEESLKN